MDRKEFARQVKEGGVRGAYLFEGPEENIKAAALSQLRKALLPEGLEELNESVMDAPSADELIAAAETLPFLADKRLVVVRDHPALSGRQEAFSAQCCWAAPIRPRVRRVSEPSASDAASSPVTSRTRAVLRFSAA